MTRAAICTLAIVALAAPAAAHGAQFRHYSGVDEDGGTIEFQTKVVHGKIKQVNNFRWRGVPIRCDQGNFRNEGAFNFGIPVRHRRFHKTGFSSVATAHVEGTFFRHGRKARGELNVKGDFGEHRTNCKTGTDDWHATRG